MKRFGIVCGALALFGPARLQAAAAPPSPNIIFVMADDLGYGDLGCYGQTRFTTPNIDRLAAEGVRFTQAYSGSAVCAPSRCALMTGFHTGHGYIRRNHEVNGAGSIPLRARDLTVAEVVRRAGYATGAFGKWGLGGVGTTGHPNAQGFDEWFGYLDQVHAHFHYTDHLFRDSRRVELERDQYSHDLIVEQAFDFVRRNAARPFFLYLSLTIPHASLEVPADSLAKYLGRFPETPFAGPHFSPQPTPRAAFAAMIDRFDGSVGRLLRLLAELAIDERTIVFLTSDNGPHRAGGGDPDFFRSSGPLRGIKRDLYEGGIRVPMLVRWPGRIAPGTVRDRPWAFWDFLPTAAALAGLPAPTGIDGVSIVPTLLGQNQAEPSLLYWETVDGGFRQAIRQGRWKALRLESGKGLELYDLESDIGETRNVAAQNPRRVARFEKLLRGARTRPAD